MSRTFKLATATLISAAVLTVTGCNTTVGAFRGAGEDTRAVANAVGIDGSSTHHYRHHYNTTHHKTMHHKKAVHHKKAASSSSTSTSTGTTAPASTTGTATQ